jgi:cyclase
LLARRIIPTLLLSRGKLVKGEQFAPDRVVGNPSATVRVFNLREVDELVVFDIDARDMGRGPDLEQIRRMSSANFVPLTVGGGIDSVCTARRLFRECGADKVALGSRGWHLAGDIADAFGRQSVVGVLSGRGDYEPYMEHFGEVIVQSRELDGTMGGYDLERIKRMAGVADCPVVASSGCGGFDDMHAALDVGADAVAAGAIWQFTQHTPLEAKEHLGGKGWPVRIT